MAAEFAPLTAWLKKVGTITDDASISRVVRAAGVAGKKAALDAAADKLGGDRKFRNFKGKPALNAGYDQSGTSQVVINFRPAGLWKLAESGRHSHGEIFPKRAGNKGRRRVAKSAIGRAGGIAAINAASGTRRAVSLPDGEARAHSSYGPSRGLKAYTDAEKKAQQTVPKAAHEQWVQEIAKVVGH
jgi:hypothetical protein